MSSFNQRTTVPANFDPYYTKTTYGGYNTAILGSPSAWTGSVLANCVGYSFGRFNEIHGTTTIPVYIGCTSGGTSPGSPQLWYARASQRGLSTGSTPRLGAVACWIETDGTGGHTANVEAINADGSIFVSESGYDHYIFRTNTYNSSYYKAGYNFQGFIYPLINFDDDMDDILYTYFARKRKRRRLLINGYTD